MNIRAFSPRPPRHFPYLAAFTLIELLVVISIIAVLAGLLLPVTSAVLNNAKKVSCRSTEMSIVAAVNNYQTEYSQYPVPTDGSVEAGSDYTYTSDGNPNNAQLFDVLRAVNRQDNGGSPTGTLNSRRINYFEARNVKNATTPKDGFILTNAQGNNKINVKVGDLVDPFGNLYGVRIDSNYNNVLVNPYSDDSKSTDKNSNSNDPVTPEQAKKQLRTGVAAFSYGADGLKGAAGVIGDPPYSPTAGDDVVSWQ